MNYRVPLFIRNVMTLWMKCNKWRVILWNEDEIRKMERIVKYLLNGLTRNIRLIYIHIV